MQSTTLSLDGVESITFQLHNLEITVSARVVEPVSGEPARASTAARPSSAAHLHLAAPPRVEDVQDPYNITVDLEEQAIAAHAVHLLQELPLGFLRHLTSRLRGTHPLWTPPVRIARAFRAGVIARRRLDGEYLNHSSPTVPYRNCYYIVLRGRGNTPGFWTTDYGTYIQRVENPLSRGELHPDTISQALPTHPECCAFLCGARKGWPQEQ